jgi:hypothetical protein
MVDFGFPIVVYNANFLFGTITDVFQMFTTFARAIFTCENITNVIPIFLTLVVLLLLLFDIY